MISGEYMDLILGQPLVEYAPNTFLLYLMRVLGQHPPKTYLTDDRLYSRSKEDTINNNKEECLHT